MRILNHEEAKFWTQMYIDFQDFKENKMTNLKLFDFDVSYFLNFISVYLR